MVAAFEIGDILDDDRLKWSHCFVKDFRDERESIGEPVCKNLEIVNVPRTPPNMVTSWWRKLRCEASY
jgi:hypothetical protein